MNRKRLSKLRRVLEGLRRQSPKALEIQKVAKQLGRKKVKRGKEPVWESLEFQSLRPLSIPDHGGRDLSPGVLHSIVNQLEDDLNSWDERLAEQDRTQRA
jgi:hypothetical protein